MSKKTQKKHQEKVIEDKTFGLKNKNKSKTVQKFIKGVVNTVKNNGKSAQMLEAQAIERKKQKKKQEQEQALLDSLYKTVGDIKKAGQSDDQQEVDPKSIVCPFFKQGLCQKGKKCKYSHDLTLDRNQELDLYIDQRTQLIMNDQNQKQMKEWDEQKLMNVIRQKQKAYIKQKPTEIVCKYFLEALQKSKYGWKWECPNGISCHYRHCLPPGYVLKKALGKVAEQEQMTIEQKIDAQRQKLFTSQSKKSELVTYEVFLKWKEAKKLRRQQEAEKKKKQEQKKGKGSSKQHVLSGKALFQFDPTLFVDDQQAIGQNVYNEREIIEQQAQEQKQKLYDEYIEEQNEEQQTKPSQQAFENKEQNQ